MIKIKLIPNLKDQKCNLKYICIYIYIYIYNYFVGEKSSMVMTNETSIYVLMSFVGTLQLEVALAQKRFSITTYCRDGAMFRPKETILPP